MPGLPQTREAMVARDVWAMVERLRDPAYAEPGSGFPADGPGAAEPGVYAFHADGVARKRFAGTLGDRARPLYVDQAGSSCRRTHVASGATLGSAIARTHLRGSTASSSFRRSVAALLWDDLDLCCDAPKRLTPASNARLTAWMLEHVRVATVVVDDWSSLWLIAEYIGHCLDPPLNLDGYEHDPVRRRIRELRTRHFSSASTDVRVDRFRELRALVASRL
jgi:hypothetical protein